MEAYLIDVMFMPVIWRRSQEMAIAFELYTPKIFEIRGKFSLKASMDSQ